MGEHKDASRSTETPQRADAQRNRERILAVAVTELTRSADTPLSVIAKKAGVGQGTFYRNFPSREALVMEIYRHELRQVAESADQLLCTREPDRALREWMDRLARFGMTKAGLADAIRQATSAPDGPAKPGHDSLLSATDRLLRACEKAGSIRPGVTADDLILALGGLWQLDPESDWRPRAARLFDLVMDGLRVGAPGRRTTTDGS
ncbi:TetR/AcrR family transcriptional regulator [Streptomyces althioticus]|uniref:TetR/AcrR family transcriptional regulator n=1 Tax=Actinomycetes TaxID=1760 RepID=UPI001875F900|nr:TetR/AcrR family transcriptional regulator [Actinospica acidiphila]MBM4827061.1 TetR/AcrR family transcriptional regulator [Actinospica acidiphila]GGQ54183.1 TetR family transcriptional regulator [Streptomyces althioticus]